MSGNRGKNPSNLTIMKLIAAAGGRCQFKGCNCNVFVDEITWGDFNNSNVAHIIASSPQGPRGTEESFGLSDKLDNLMLMCTKHHKEIDTKIEKYSVEVLREMKRVHEEKVQELLDCMNFSKSEIVILQSPIKGNVDVHVDKNQTVEALRLLNRNPASMMPTLLDIKSYGEYRSKQYWEILVKELEQTVERLINSRLQYNPELMLAVFPLAPIPLIAKLGEILSDKRGIDIFQKKRVPNTWSWEVKEATNSFEMEQITLPEGDAEKVALVLSLTAQINLDRVMSVFEAGTILHIQAKKKGVDCLQSIEDLKLFWNEYQRGCDLIKNNNIDCTVAVFPAVPVSAAFEIGRRHMKGVHMPLHIYDDECGFFEALVIGGK